MSYFEGHTLLGEIPETLLGGPCATGTAGGVGGIGTGFVSTSWPKRQVSP